MKYTQPLITNVVAASVSIKGEKGSQHAIDSGPRQVTTTAAYSADE